MASRPYSFLSAAASVVDRAMLAAMSVRGRADRARVDAMPHLQRIERLAEVRQLYENAELPKPGEPNVTLRRARSSVWDVSFTSAFEPHLDAVADRYMSRIENRTVRARLYSQERARAPAIVAIHGYMGGQWLLEENQWPIEWLMKRGLDVVLPVLPFHAARAGNHRGPPNFPSSDPRMTIEGFRQAISDMRSIALWLRARGAPHVGFMGMSLGGYTTSLLATIEQDIDFAVPIIPLASIADFAREQGRLGVGAEAEELYGALDAAHGVVSPFTRALKIPAERALVVAAEHDQITPVAHAAKIAEHFGCEILTIAGGHLLQIGRGDAFRAVMKLIERAGVNVNVNLRST